MNSEVLIIGAGGAGMMCAIHAARRGRRVLILDHAKKIGGKILISGGGRCNFTNTGASPANYVSRNPHFCKSALSRYPSENFVEMVKEHRIPFHEKKLGQLFCDGSAQAIVDLLQSECATAGVEVLLDTRIERVEKLASRGFRVESSNGPIDCESLVIATGGLSIPKIGATGFGYGIAKQFGLKLVETVPALDGFVFADAETRSLQGACGRLNRLRDRVGRKIVSREYPVYPQRPERTGGASGIAALESRRHGHDRPFAGPGCFAWFLQKKKEGSRAIVKNLVAELLPNRFAERFCDLYFNSTLPLPQVSEKALEAFCQQLKAWKIVPGGTVGYSKAEVTRGGVDTDELSSKTMEAQQSARALFHRRSRRRHRLARRLQLPMGLGVRLGRGASRLVRRLTGLTRRPDVASIVIIGGTLR